MNVIPKIHIKMNNANIAGLYCIRVICAQWDHSVTFPPRTPEIMEPPVHMQTAVGRVRIKITTGVDLIIDAIAAEENEHLKRVDPLQLLEVAIQIGSAK